MLCLIDGGARDTGLVGVCSSVPLACLHLACCSSWKKAFLSCV